MLIGFNMTIDVTRLDKSRFYKGKKGTYAKLTCFVDTEETSQYGDNGTMIKLVFWCIGFVFEPWPIRIYQLLINSA